MNYCSGCIRQTRWPFEFGYERLRDLAYLRLREPGRFGLSGIILLAVLMFGGLGFASCSGVKLSATGSTLTVPTPESNAAIAPECEAENASPDLECDKEVLLAIRDSRTAFNSSWLTNWQIDTPVEISSGISGGGTPPQVIVIALEQFERLRFIPT